MKWLVVLLIGYFLLACKEVKTDDLAIFVNEIKAKSYPVNDKSPVLIDHSALPFIQQDSRSPFLKPKLINGIIEHKKVPKGCLQPNLKRNRGELESFALGDLKMRGTLQINNQLWAIVEAPNNLFYKVEAGNYLGLNNGKISRISKVAIILSELKIGRDSCWEKQVTEIKLLLNE